MNYDLKPTVWESLISAHPVADLYLNAVEYVYVYTSKVFAYDFDLYCYDFLVFVSGYTNDIFLSVIIEILLFLSDHHLFFSIVADYISSTAIYNHYFCTDFYKTYISYQTVTLFVIYHPELAIHFHETNEWLKTLGPVTNFILDLVSINSFLTPTFQFIDTLITFYGILFLIVIYFSCLISSLKKSNDVDSDYLSASIAVESEKEVGSIDDLLGGIFIAIHLFGWFFYMYAWNYLVQHPEMIMVFYIAPFLLFLMIGVPVVLIWDFGLCFLTYIRGGSANQMFLPELIYDYINIGAFFLRLCLQIVRIFLMLLTYCALCDVFLFSHDLGRGVKGFEEIWKETCSMGINFDALAYVLVDTFPRLIVRFIFEIGHTIAVCSIQYFAFFAIVFWFFLFLYTFFLAVKLEAYIWEKRVARKNIINNYLKNKDKKN